MRIDFQKQILDFEGEPIIRREAVKDEKGTVVKSEKKLLLVNACQEALGGAYQDEAALPQSDRVKRFGLAMRLDSQLPVEISVEEAGEILRLVAKFYLGSLIYPRVSQIFDAASSSAEKE